MKLLIEELPTKLSSFEMYKRFSEDKQSFFLDSCGQGAYSFIGSHPFLTFLAKNGKTIISHQGKDTISKKNPFRLLQSFIKNYAVANKTEFPFIGGAVGFFSYDLRHHLEKLSQHAVDDLHVPDMIMSLYDNVIIIHHAKKKAYLATTFFPQENSKYVQMRKNYILETLNVKKNARKKTVVKKEHTTLRTNFTFENYCKMIEKARSYIKNGDLYQVNLSQRFSKSIKEHPIDIYEQLRKKNPAPFSAYLNFTDLQILCSSPERFLRIHKGQVETKPIKGTIPRGKTHSEDEKNKFILRNSKKDAAENHMIVDLLRNDLGKVCRFGSVQVTKLCEIESYATVHHLVSTIIGTLRAETDCIDCIMACFPGGSITGAPKIQAMEIIDSLEPTTRGIYTGSLGYIGFDQTTDLNIAIRTLIVKKNHAYYQVGGGIIWDSVPAKEYSETLAKGSAFSQVLKE